MAEPTHLSEESKVSFALRTLVTVLGATANVVSGYLSVTNRLSWLEQRAAADEEQIQQNEDWINGFEPPAAVKDTVERVRELEIRIAVLETLINNR